MGTTQRLTLSGDNPPVYRGAMDFAGGDSGKKKSSIQSVSSGLDGGATQPGGGAGDDTSAAPASTDVAPIGNGGSMVPSSAFSKTDEEEAVQGHPKGCGCVAAGLEVEPAAAPLASAIGMLGLGLAFAGRRRSR